MAHSHLPHADTEKYPGPSQVELGSLADWMSATEFSQLRAGARPVRAPSTPLAPRPPQYRRPERCSEPIQQEPEEIADGPGSPTCSRPTGRTTDSRPAPSIPVIEAELWVSETSAGANRSVPEAVRSSADVPKRRVSDPFLDQLDEIETALRKRPPRNW